VNVFNIWCNSLITFFLNVFFVLLQWSICIEIATYTWIPVFKINISVVHILVTTRQHMAYCKTSYFLSIEICMPMHYTYVYTQYLIFCYDIPEYGLEWAFLERSRDGLPRVPDAENLAVIAKRKSRINRLPGRLRLRKVNLLLGLLGARLLFFALSRRRRWRLRATELGL